ncbi:sensor histidine kinase [Capsulimonas corticalis]|nr:histidine kinase [Capsulimonas corticalis]
MNSGFLQLFNAFLEDTCVLVTVAYLLSRGALLPKLFDRSRTHRDQVVLALIFGLVGVSELFLPGDRRPYVPFTLAAGFAGYAGGLSLGLLTCGVSMILAVAALATGSGHLLPLVYALSVLAAALIGAAVAGSLRRWSHPSLASLIGGAFVTGALAEGAHLCLRWCAIAAAHGTTGRHAPVQSIQGAVASMGANSLGCMLIALVLQDAYERRRIVQRSIAAEREVAALRLTQLGELQARLHPHFLFNALAAIAGLCLIDPGRAERAITDLGSLLRRFLQSPREDAVSLQEEIDTIHSYLAIERLRLGNRLTVIEDFPSDLRGAKAPRFCLQIPVENAVQHGLAKATRPGTLRLRARRQGRFLSLVVADDGVGVRPRPADIEAGAVHGLDLLKTRLRIAYGDSATLRLRAAPGGGTICRIRLPIANEN